MLLFLSEVCPFRMSVECPTALCRAAKNLKKDIPRISVLAFGMFRGCPTDIQRIRPMSEINIFWTSTGLTCVMWDFSDKNFFLIDLLDVVVDIRNLNQENVMQSCNEVL
jgi:hypothetical protein